MKQLFFSILLAIFFIACDKNYENPIETTENQTEATENQTEVTENQLDLTEIRIKDRPCEILEYVGKIGNDFDSALDSLRNRRYIPLEINKELLEVLFDYDNRQFYGIMYGDCGMYADVLDTKGNYYLRSWYCPNEIVIVEETVFKNNKIYKLGGYGCGTIVYEGRIGNDFDSALDPLRIIYKQTLEHYGEGGYYIDKEKIIVDFSYDSRDFFLLTFIDKKNIYNWLLTSIVIDEKGNYFYVNWCED